MKGFDRSDSSLLGFAVSSLAWGAISLDEFHLWAANALVGSPEAAELLVELLEFAGPPAKIYGVIGFVPDWPYPEASKAALAAIAYRRGTPPVDCGIAPDEAEAKSLRFPQIETRFKEMFPFVGADAYRSKLQ